MRSASLVFASLLLVVGAPSVWGDDEPSSESSATAALVPESAPVAPLDTPVAEAAGVTLGPVGYDVQGRPGRLHVVVRGDTLWDISEAYLGTPWVWPSVWQDNEDIANPHLIRPGDRIWITKDEMRRVTEEEAERLLAGSPASDVPAALEEAAPAALAPPPVLFPFHRIDAMGLVSREQVEAAASVVDSPLDRIWLAEHDTVFVGLGRGEVQEGDELTIFRTAEKVMHPQTGGFFGYYVNVLGWAQVTEVGEETSTATIRQSYEEMRRGDRVLPREELDPSLQLRQALRSVEGRILYTPSLRTQMATADIVYLDRGVLDGLEVGNPLEVYRPGKPTPDGARREAVQTPDWMLAKLLVVATRENSAVALVIESTRELGRGDLFRTAQTEVPH